MVLPRSPSWQGIYALIIAWSTDQSRVTMWPSRHTAFLIDLYGIQKEEVVSCFGWMFDPKLVLNLQKRHFISHPHGRHMEYLMWVIWKKTRPHNWNTFRTRPMIDWLIDWLTDWLIGFNIVLIQKGHVKQPPNYFDTSLEKLLWISLQWICHLTKS